MEVGDLYFIPNVLNNKLFSMSVWYESKRDLELLKKGLVFDTEEQATRVATKMLEVME